MELDLKLAFRLHSTWQGCRTRDIDVNIKLPLLIRKNLLTLLS